ncbi:MAG: hypothetical protein HYU51_11790 [Candidatus Rokubacteria bacterium]|nr:hypothetical protein [Candidatus Rokubacteria bacterium]
MSRRRRPAARVPRTPPSRISRDKLLGDLRLAARKGDRVALELALAQMRTLALTPRYWEKYLGLLRNPLARLVDLLAIKQGERIARLKGWKLPRPAPADGVKGASDSGKAAKPSARRRRSTTAGAEQPSLF